MSDVSFTLFSFFPSSSVAKVELQCLGDIIISEKHTVAERDSMKAETTTCLVHACMVCVRIHVYEPNVPLLHVF